jgi:hypothetical protein
VAAGRDKALLRRSRPGRPSRRPAPRSPTRRVDWIDDQLAREAPAAGGRAGSGWAVTSQERR